MKFKIFSLFLLFGIFANAQIKKFSIEANYPLPVDNNFVGKNYDGVIDLGLKYRMVNLVFVNFGLALNSSMLTASDTGYFPEFDETLSFKSTLITIQPQFYGEINLRKLTKLRPSAAIGYSVFVTNSEYTSPETNIPDESRTQSGVNVNVGLSYDITGRLYIHANYDYVKLIQMDSDIPKETYNTDVSLLKIGVGIRI